MTSPNYYRATNFAYEVLVNNKNFSLPIDIFRIASSFIGLRIISFSEMANRFGMSFQEFIDCSPSKYGFLIRKNSNSNCAYIVYNEKKEIETIKFTIAHELGHYVLGHNSKFESESENKEANCFARNILCPVPIANDLGVANILDYINVFCISEPMANVCVDKKDVDFYYITKSLYDRIKDLLFVYMSGYTEEYIYSVR